MHNISLLLKQIEQAFSRLAELATRSETIETELRRHQYSAGRAAMDAIKMGALPELRDKVTVLVSKFAEDIPDLELLGLWMSVATLAPIQPLMCKTLKYHAHPAVTVLESKTP